MNLFSFIHFIMLLMFRNLRWRASSIHQSIPVQQPWRGRWRDGATTLLFNEIRLVFTLLLLLLMNSNSIAFLQLEIFLRFRSGFCLRKTYTRQNMATTDFPSLFSCMNWSNRSGLIKFIRLDISVICHICVPVCVERFRVAVHVWKHL